MDPFGPEILEEYLATFRDPARVHGICEEYRAAATIDMDHDRADKGRFRENRLPDVAPVGKGRPSGHFIHERWMVAGHLAAVGSECAWASYEGWPLFSR